ncbi:hypothetical protein AYO40_01185 [Planctomycetaceae bacterium SCGC AG-212-D15]|nr:hypothetical protein AYO40_01185 [Planctomycetaceae bacterium SCGC AG-212-D15]
MICESSAEASFLASFHHKYHRLPSCQSGPNFNQLWTAGLNAGHRKMFTHLAMVHADIKVYEEDEHNRWADILLAEMDKFDADFISVPVAIKDPRGLTSCGIGDPGTRWNPWRRFCTNELSQMPETFDKDMIGYGDKYLLHNHALCMWDLRKPIWYETTAEGRAKALFNFSEEIWWDGTSWNRRQDSEDWAFSRNLWEMGAKTVITRKIKVSHHGQMSFANHGDWGSLKNGDEDTAANWRDSAPPLLKPAKRTSQVDVLDLVLNRENHSNFFFVQVGAHDGHTLDPIRPYVDKYKWRGVVVEPNPSSYQRLVESYEGNDRVKHERAAIVDHDGEVSMYAFREGTVPYHATMLCSVSEEALEFNSHGYQGPIDEITVPAMKMATLIKKHNIKHIDLLQVDAEGCDRAIIEACFAAGVQPTIIHFENGFGKDHTVPPCLGDYATCQLGIDIVAYKQRDTGFAKRSVITQKELEQLQPA